MGIKIIQPFTVFCRQANWLSKTKRIGLDHARISGAAFALVGGQNDIVGPLAQDIGKHQIGRSHPVASINHEQTDIGHINRAFGQTAHTALQTVVRHIFQTRRIHNGKPQIRQPRFTFAQVARHARLVIDQRQSLADKAVEKRRFAHIRAPHNGKGERHPSKLQYSQPEQLECAL